MAFFNVVSIFKKEIQRVQFKRLTDFLSQKFVGFQFNFCFITSAQRSAAMSSPVAIKPPNIAIYTSENDKKSEEQFKKCKGMLSRPLVMDRYVFFHINDQQVLHEPWQNNVEILVILNKLTNENIVMEFKKFLNAKGKIFCMPLCLPLMKTLTTKAKCLNFSDSSVTPINLHHSEIGSVKYYEKDILDVIEICEDIFVKTDNGGGVIGELKSATTNGKLVFSQICLYERNFEEYVWMEHILLNILRDRFNLDCKTTFSSTKPCVTPCIVFYDNLENLAHFKSELKSHSVHAGNRFVLTENETKFIFESKENDDSTEDKELVVPVLFENDIKSGFDRDTYFKFLKSKKLGKVVIYNDIISSTMDIINSARVSESLISIAGRQISGKGRGKHVWLSPEGCAMFSLRLDIPLSSTLGHHMTFIQHLTALAMVEGVKEISGLKDLEIKLKWPNDIYYKNVVKIGGLLVESAIDSRILRCTIGCGLNVNNGHPTVCLNDMIRESGQKPILRIEQVIAQIITKLEELITDFQQEGLKSVLPLYYSNWLHSDAEVQVCICDGEKKMARILGLDDYGFLKVQLLREKITISVQPDGNSFDVLHNLLIVKTVV